MPDQALAQPTRTRFRSGDGTSLSVFDYDGAGQLTLFLHGLAGHAGEWTDVAARMTTETRKVAFDQARARSEHAPPTWSREGRLRGQCSGGDPPLSINKPGLSPWLNETI
jgi:hypothetical protein